MQTSNGSSQFLEKLKAIEASRAAVRPGGESTTWWSLRSTFWPKPAGKKKFYNQATGQLENR